MFCNNYCFLTMNIEFMDINRLSPQYKCDLGYIISNNIVYSTEILTDNIL